MDDRPKIELNYATLAVEDDADRLAAERLRRAEDYNEATFGERRPWVGAVSRFLILLGIIALITLVLPRRVGYVVALLVSIGFAIWERRRYG